MFYSNVGRLIFTYEKNIYDIRNHLIDNCITIQFNGSGNNDCSN